MQTSRKGERQDVNAGTVVSNPPERSTQSTSPRRTISSSCVAAVRDPDGEFAYEGADGSRDVCRDVLDSIPSFSISLEVGVPAGRCFVAAAHGRPSARRGRPMWGWFVLGVSAISSRRQPSAAAAGRDVR